VAPSWCNRQGILISIRRPVVMALGAASLEHRRRATEREDGTMR
jgi:hypothetical protein